VLTCQSTSGRDTAAADHWFAEAVRQAPDLPMAYYEWGQALLARGDLAGAVRELSLAHAKGPHFADALKVWGDVLAKQGHWSDALAKYDEALTYAPDWVALKQARDAAASKRG
jgi:tetratricopeptide (TPR) repeat protein